MWKRCLLAAIALVLTQPAYSSAIASSSATPPSRNPAGDGIELDQQMINRELELFRAAQISLCQALLTAEKLHPGSRTWDIGFDGTSASPVYRVKTVKIDRIWGIDVDARTGEVAGNEIVSSVKDLRVEDRNSVIALRSVQQGLLDAILVGERAAKGKAIGATMTKETEKFNFVVVIVSGEHLKQVTLEPPKASRREPHPRRPAVIQPCG